MGVMAVMDARISLLGRFEVRVGDAVVLDRTWSRRKAAALLKLLALQKDRSLHRERVMEALWPDLDPAAALNNLHKNLHHVRTALAERGAPTGLISAGGEMVALSPDVWVDCHAFRAAAAGAEDDPAGYEAALALYGGPLLPEDLYEDWTGPAREELQGTYVALVVRLGALYEAHDQLERALQVWQRVFDADPAHEAAHRALMRLYASTGSRHRALRQYQQCREALQRELGVEPEVETERLYRAILAGGAGEPAAAGTPAVSSSAPVTLAALAVPRRRQPLPPFFGRERELELAEELLDAVVAGEGRALFITGVAGIGKSRFAEQVLAAAAERGALTLRGRSYQAEAAAYQPLREMLQQIADSSTEAGPATAGATQLLRRSLHLRRLVPDPTARVEAGAPPVVAADAALLQAELFDEVADLFAALPAAGRPLALVFDDLHAADDGSLRLVHALCRRLAEHPVLVLATYRAETADRSAALDALLGSLRRERLCQEIALGPLPETAMRLVVEQLLGGMSAERELVREFVERAGGNPLFAGELAHTAVEEGWVRLVDGRWQRRRDETIPVPAAVRDLVDQRLRRLSSAALQATQLAATSRRGVEYAVLRRATGLTEGVLLDALDDCLAAHVVEEVPGGYRFRHDLLRDAVYDRLSEARRRHLHRTLAAALTEAAESAERDDRAEEIGHHFAQSDEPWRAVPYLLSAGRRAAAVFANDEAVRIYERALEIAQAHPSRTEPRLRAALQNELGDLLQRRGDAARAADLFEAACGTLAAAGDDSEAVAARGKAALARIAAGDVDRAAALMQTTLQAITEQSPEMVVARTYYILAQLHWHNAQYRDALAAAEKAFQAAVASGDAAQRAHAYEVLALACHSLGDWQKGVECELNRQAIGVGGFDTDEAFDAHL